LIEFLLDVEQDFSSFLKLFPKEVFSRIFSYCDAKDLGRLGRVCKLFLSISMENSLWYKHCVSQQTILPADWKVSKSYKSIYISHVGRLEVAEVDWSNWNLKDNSNVIDEKYKFLVAGDPKIGKSCFIRRITEGKFEEGKLEVDHKEIRRGLSNGRIIGISIWELPKDWSSKADRFFNDTKAIFVCFDLTQQKTFDNLASWLEIVDVNCFWAEPVIIGFKTDAKEKRVVSFEQAKQFADKMGMKYFEVSSKDEQNVVIPVAWMTYHIWDLERPDETSTPIASPVSHRKGSSISPTNTPIIRKRSVPTKNQKGCHVM